MMFNTSIFTGLRFFLAGFTPQQYLQVKSNLTADGGVVVEEYGPDCTHVIVHNLVIDDPVCVAAIKDGKILVTSLWADHSLEAGGPVETDNIMYRPVKELTGIPGANKLVICLTGYQGPERDDIMIKVHLMGAQFTKPLTANKVTHLICYKFEGDKYELARKVPFTKIVNHQWLDDCLKTWKILPEEPYSNKSGFEVEMQNEAQDSEEENGDISGRNRITTLQNGSKDSKNHSVTPSKLSIPSTEQGLSKSSIVNGGELLKSDFLSESRSVNILDKLPEQSHNVLYQKDAKCDNADAQIKNGCPLTTVNAVNETDFDGEKVNIFNSSVKKPPRSSLPLHVREDSKRKNGANSPSKKSSRSRASLHSAGKFSQSGRMDENLAEKIDDLPTFNLETDNEVVSGCAGAPSSKRLNGSLQSALRLSNLDEKVEKSLSEKVSADVCSSTVGKDQGKAASAFGTVAGSLDDKGSSDLRSRKRTADGSNLSHTTKNQKLTSSASKRVDAADPKTLVTLSGSQTRDESACRSADRSSPNFSSINSSAKNIASRSPAFDLLPSSKPINTQVVTCPNSNNCASTSLNLGIKRGEPQNLYQSGTASPGTNGLKDMKFGSRELNSGEKTNSSDSKPPRRKMVARKTLGSRSKISKRSTDAQRSSVIQNSFRDDAATRPLDQDTRDEPTPFCAADKDLLPPTIDDPLGLGSKPHLDTKVKDRTELFDDDTESPPELVVCDEKFSTAEQLHSVKLKTGEASGIQVLQAEICNSDSDQKHRQGISVAETVGAHLILEPQKNKVVVKAKKKPMRVAKDAVKNADDIEGGKNIDRVKEQVVGAAGKKRCGTLLLNKSKRPVECCNDHIKLGKEKEPECNDQYANKGLKDCGKLALKKRRGTLLLNKSEGVVDVENEHQGEGENDGKLCPGELAATSNTSLGDMEDKNKSDSTVHNDQCTSKVAKRPGIGKKRRGTLLLKNSDSIDMEKENESVFDGGQPTRKLARPSGVLDKSTELEKENVTVGNNQGRGKDGKRAGKLVGKKRRGTLLLNKSEAQVDEEKENDLVSEDKSKCEILAEKLSPKSNLTANMSDAAESTSSNIHEVKEAQFILSGHRLQRKEFQQLIKRLKGKVCRDSHQWSYQATHFIVPDPVRRTEKFFAAAASGSWILKTDYLTASSQAEKLLPEEPYEWHKNGLNEDGAISLEAPRKWRLLKQKTGHGAFYGMRIVIYGECIAPSLDTLKRVVKAGDGIILATSPPYTRFLESEVDFAIVSPGMPRVDIWVQEFLKHQIPCVLADYLVEYVCKPGYSLDRHVQYNTHEWAAKSFAKLLCLSEEVIHDAATPDDQITDDLACQVCGSTDRGEVMLICGNENGSVGCGIGTHIDCCDPPLEKIPEEDWFCPQCAESQ
ncbi:unnamed protein product [Amaranthus hypochondriacus]